MATTAPAPYYDPYDFDIDADPYPVWKRLRDEAPLYFNEKYEFYAISRYDDVERALVEWQTYSSAKGSVLEMIKAGIEMPPGMFIFEDPPDHDLHRGIMSRVFTPRRMAAIEPQVRDYAARTLDPLVGAGGFDFIADLGAEIPMRTIGMLLGIPEEDQQAIRAHIDEGLRLEAGVMPDIDLSTDDRTASDYGAYIDWRAQHPSDDLMTELLTAEFTDETGTLRTLTRDEILGYIGLLSGAGNETTTRLIGWAGKLLAEHPEQRRDLVQNPGLIPAAIEECLRYEPPSPVQARSVTTRRRAPRPDRPGRERHGAPQRLGQPRRAGLRRSGPVRHPPQGAAPPELRLRPALLPGRAPGAARGPRRARKRCSSASRSGTWTRTARCRPGRRPCGAGRSSRCAPRDPGPRAVPRPRPWLRRS